MKPGLLKLSVLKINAARLDTNSQGPLCKYLLGARMTSF